MMDPFIKNFTASQMRGAVMGSAVCMPLVSFLTNLRCRSVSLEHAITDGILSVLCITFIVAWGSSFVFQSGLKKNPWFRLEDHPLGDNGGIILELLPRSFTGIGAVFALLGSALCALTLYLIFYFSGISELAFGSFIIFKLIFPAIPGLVTAKYAALNNFRYR
jgi:hypothetical protein